MINGLRVLGFVTARGGSKGLPGKNLRDLCGKPLIAWSIETALRSETIDELVVSTDSQEIADVSRRYGAEVPFLRPSALATDTATSIAVVAHAIDWLRAAGREYDILVLIEPTSPLRETHDVDAAVRQMIDAQAGAIVSVCRADATHPAFIYRKGAGERLTPYDIELATSPRRQDVEPMFFLEGTVYASKIGTLLERGTFCHEGTVGYEVPKWKSPEVDDIVDFLLIEAIMRHRGLGTS
jgi:N-acylneuraminate cytidylyltransferase/CMP-N,N'-diacetyllegionaminic acid synthase